MTSTVAISATAPDSGEVGTPVLASNPFTLWYFTATKTATQSAFQFQDVDAKDCPQVGDKVDVWWTQGPAVSASVTANTANAAFELAGAAELTVAAASAIVAALLF
jgi:hypothetical protein